MTVPNASQMPAAGGIDAATADERVAQPQPGAEMGDPARRVARHIVLGDADAAPAGHRSVPDALPKAPVRPPVFPGFGRPAPRAVHGPNLFFIDQTIERPAP